MADKEQEKPFAPASHRIAVEEDLRSFSMELDRQNCRKKKYVKCCGCIAAIILIQLVIVLVLAFTVFHVKYPVMRMKSMTLNGLDQINRTTGNLAGTHITAIAEVSVKNSNVASFRYNNATTSLYYGGVVVGEAKTSSGTARARRTVRLNVTMDVEMDKLLAVPRLVGDLAEGALPVSSYSRISGLVKILMVKKHVVVTMNCTMTINVTSRAIQDQNCRRHVTL